ncbi:MAG: hypothetical protein P4M14_10280, partial [Gammaproteobacteria bacterium]|nr:hypothetical protein [Gammaproteobacteria bacterium]
TSTGFLQSEIDVHAAVLNQLKTSTGFLQSEIDACCATLKTSTGFLQSEIDVIRSSLFTSTGFLQSEIDACCAALKTSTGFLQSEIDACCAALKTSTGFLQSEIDACCAVLKTSTGFLQSEIDVIRSSLFTSTGFLQSEIDACYAALKTSTGFLQSEIDRCCAVLKTSTGFLQSEIDVIRSSLFTSTGFLQSEIDACCAALKTSTGLLQSQIDNICSMTCITRFIPVFSRLDILESCCAELRTSTGFLQSEIDAPSCFECPDCCNVSFLTSKAWLSPDPLHFSDNVSTVDWSYDSKYVAIGLSNFSALLDGTPAVQVYQLNNGCSPSLSLVATFSFDCTRDISEVRWHPSEYRLAVGRGDAKIATPCVTQLHIFDFNPAAPVASALTNTSNGEANHSVYAVSWRPAPLDASHDILAVGREVTGAEVAIYTVDNAGVLSVTPIVTATTGGQVQFKALDWDASSTYLAVGVAQAQTLQLFTFNPVGPTLTLATSDSVGGHTVLSVNWNQNIFSSDLLAVGLSSFPNPADPLVQVYRFTGPSTLTNLCGISGLTDDIPALDWHPNGKCLAITQDFDLTFGSQFITYAFNKAACIFTQDSLYQFGDINLEDVRWAPNGRDIVVANDFCDSTAPSTLCPSGSIPGAITVYDNACLSFTELVSIVDELSCCCEELRTSTGLLQSEIDSCCNALKTSTGFLQSEIDACCIALQTSTGFLQSQIDICCSRITTPTCIIIIDTDTFYDPVADPRMLLLPGQAVVFEFSPCVGANEIPRLIFNKAVYDPLNINNGQVVLPVDSQLIFQGTGFVELQDVGGFNLQGVDINDDTTPPNIVIQDKATMHLCSPSINPNVCADGTTWTVQGIGRFIIREDGQLLLDNISQMIFGAATTDFIDVQVEAASSIVIDVPITSNISDTSNAFVTFQLGTFNIEFSDFSALDIRRGIFELNTNKGVAAQGNIQQFNFTDSSSLNIARNAEVLPSTQATWLALAPNLLNAAIGFNNETGVIYGNGDMRFRSLDLAAPIDTVLLLQNNFIALDDTMVELFLNLAIRLGPNYAQIHPSDLNILVQIGAASSIGTFRQLAAIKQVRDGSVQLLLDGDHDVAYQTTGSFITGFNQNSRYFKIDSSGNRVTY